MGYTHSWIREREIDPETFSKIVQDFKSILPGFKFLDIKLADGRGEGEPIVNESEVIFNGSRYCGHKENKNIVISWPSTSPKSGVAPNSDNAVVGSSFAGIVLNQRMCNGDCSRETFCFERKESGKYYDFCKTAFRPYDLAVQTFLVIAKHYLKERIIVESDGDMEQWLEAVKICQNALGYGYEDFQLSGEVVKVE